MVDILDYWLEAYGSISTKEGTYPLYHSLKVFIREPLDFSAFRFRGFPVSSGDMYVACDDGIVKFYYKAHDSGNLGGLNPTVTMLDGEKRLFFDCWSSNAEVVTLGGCIPCVDTYIIAQGRDMGTGLALRWDRVVSLLSPDDLRTLIEGPLSPEGVDLSQYRKAPVLTIDRYHRIWDEYISTEMDHSLLGV